MLKANHTSKPQKTILNLVQSAHYAYSIHDKRDKVVLNLQLTQRVPAVPFRKIYRPWIQRCDVVG